MYQLKFITFLTNFMFPLNRIIKEFTPIIVLFTLPIKVSPQITIEVIIPFY